MSHATAYRPPAVDRTFTHGDIPVRDIDCDGTGGDFIVEIGNEICNAADVRVQFDYADWLQIRREVNRVARELSNEERRDRAEHKQWANARR